MSKICPNCLRPVRTGANYCGYCGTSLVPTPRDPAPTTWSSTKESAVSLANTSPRARRTPKSNQFGRSWIKVPIILLGVVLLLALAFRFWPEILVFISQGIHILRLS